MEESSPSNLKLNKEYSLAAEDLVETVCLIKCCHLAIS